MFRSWQRTKQQEAPTMQPSMKGVLDEDGWKCNCSPRLPATQFDVKKEGPNKGRKFYTCSNRDTGCKFFLWDDDARARENDRASEPKLIPQPPTPRTTPRRSSRINPTPPSAQAPPPTKRRISDLDLDSSASDFESEDEDEVEVDDGNDDDDNDLDEISYNWNGPITRAHGVSTPRKERRTSARTSPSKARFPRTGLATPISGAGRRFFAEAMAETNDEDGDDIFNTPPVFSARNNIFAPLATPKSAARLLGSPGRGLRDDLITDVFALLTKHNVNLKESARELRELLKRQVWQKEGISQGREVARQALARKTEECEELKAQVEELDAEKADAEREQETLRSQMFELTNELEQVRLSQSQKSQASTQMSTQTQ